MRRTILLALGGSSAALVLLVPPTWSLVPTALLPLAAWLPIHRAFKAEHISRLRLLSQITGLVLAASIVSALLEQLDPPPHFDSVRVALLDGAELKGLLVVEKDAAVYIAVGETLRVVPTARVAMLTVLRRPPHSLPTPLVVQLARLL